ncbi:hypothetical protein ACJX0J_022243 [Zea mays]
MEGVEKAKRMIKFAGRLAKREGQISGVLLNEEGIFALLRMERLKFWEDNTNTRPIITYLQWLDTVVVRILRLQGLKEVDLPRTIIDNIHSLMDGSIFPVRNRIGTTMDFWKIAFAIHSTHCQEVIMYAHLYEGVD